MSKVLCISCLLYSRSLVSIVCCVSLLCVFVCSSSVAWPVALRALGCAWNHKSHVGLC